jgi:membrane protease YdiL (CAAX protease family)
LPDTDKREDLRALTRRALAELDRPAWLLLALAACMPVVYVYQGAPAFYIQRVAPPGAAQLEVAAQLWRFGSAFVLFFVVPALSWRLVARRPLRELGLRLGDWRAGLRITGIALVVLCPLLWFSSAQADFLAEYPMARAAFDSARLIVIYELCYGLYYWGWEFLFRGALQLGLTPALGISGACIVQLLPSVLLHIGKPVGETWAALVAAPAFGLVAVRTRSFLPLFVLHYAIGVLNDLFCALRLGLMG